MCTAGKNYCSYTIKNVNIDLLGYAVVFKVKNNRLRSRDERGIAFKASADPGDK